MGHGIRAALIASMLRGLMNNCPTWRIIRRLSLLPSTTSSPKSWQRVNTTMFASAVYIYLDLETGVMTASTAGHPHPIILGPDGVARKMPLPRGIALGLLDDATYHNAQFLRGPAS